MAKINNKGIPSNLIRGTSNRDFDPSPSNSVGDDDDHHEEEWIKASPSMISVTVGMYPHKDNISSSVKEEKVPVSDD